MPPVVGLLYAILAGLLYVIAFLRARHSREDLEDDWEHDESLREEDADAVLTIGQEDGRKFGRPFKTAGWFIVAVTVIVALIEIGLLILILRI